MLPYEISVTDVKTRLDRGDSVVLLDVREPWETATSSIDGAVCIPMGELPARANNELDPDSEIVVFCHLGMRSLNVTAWLREQGYDHVQSMAGGIDRWTREIDPKVPLY